MVTRIAVLSGKGGVGKSSVACLIAKILSENHKTLLLDMDLCGPSTAHILNQKGRLLKAERGLVPSKVTPNLDLISMSLLIKDNDAVIWRAPKKISVLEMFYESVNHDFVIYDTPPGVSEEHFFLENKTDFVFLVTTSQNVALSDSLRSIEFAKENNLKILGVLENMAGLECSKCKKVTNVFSVNGGEELAKEYSLDFLGRVSYDYKLLEITNKGNFLEECEVTDSYRIIKEILKKKEII